MKKIAFLTVLAGLLMGCSSTLTVDNTPIDSLDLNRYLGDWYEIARFDNRLERVGSYTGQPLYPEDR